MHSLCSMQYSVVSVVCAAGVLRSTVLSVQLRWYAVQFCMRNWMEFWGVQYCTTGVLGSSVLYHRSSRGFNIIPREFWGVQYCTTGVLGSSVLYLGSSGEFSIVPREFWGVQYCTTGVLGSSILYHGSSGEFGIVPWEF